MAKKTVTGEETETEVVTTDVEETEQDDSTTLETTDEVPEGEDVEAEEEGESDSDLDLDAELEQERKNGEPDTAIADQEFKKREEKRKEKEAASGEADKPLTRADFNAALEADRKERRTDDALILARKMAGSEKEAQLILQKWKNRTFPKNLPLSEQLEETYVITHRKKLLGERNEAMRALHGRDTVTKVGITNQRTAQNAAAPKLPPSEVAILKQSGLTYNNTLKRFEKKLPNGRILIRDNKTKQIKLLPIQRG